MTGAIEVGYTVEQCWHDTPGGTAVAAIEIARELALRPDDVRLRFVAGKHANVPAPQFRPPGPVAMLPLARPWLYETWLRLRWPKIESVTGPIDVAHATGLVPCGTSVPMVVTVHDIAFDHTPEKFTRHGVRVMRRSLETIRQRAAMVICSSRSTRDDLAERGFADDRLRIVPLGVRSGERPTRAAIDAVRRRLALPERFVLFVGTVEPRKNLTRLAEAMRRIAAEGTDLPLVIAGSSGWGDVVVSDHVDARFLGFVRAEDLSPLYAAATVFAYPSEREGFGLPVLEAMASGTPVVTSRGTSTEEVAAGAAVLVDPFDVDAIADGVSTAIADSDRLSALGTVRAAEMTWALAAEHTLGVYREVIA